MKTTFAAALLLVTALSGARPAAAQQVDLTFSPNTTRAISVSLQGSVTYYAFGAIQVGSASVGNLPIQITNTGNVATTLALEVSNQATDQGINPVSGLPMNQHWSLSASTSPGVDQFALFAVFQSTKPTIAQFGDLDHSVRESGSGLIGPCASVNRFAGQANGLRVPAATGSNTRDVYLILHAPTRSSNLKLKNFNVSVTTGGCD